MKCDGCGHEFPPDEATLDTRNEPIGPMTPMGQKTQMVHLTLCAQCAAHREQTKAMIFWPVVVLGVIVALCILSSILNYIITP